MQTQFEELTDTQWQFIEQILKEKRKRKHSLRLVVNGLLYILRTGCQWRNLTNMYPCWQVVYYYFRKWQRNGTLERLNSELNKHERKRQGKEETPSLICIDSQSVKSVSFVVEEKGIDGNKKVNGRKRHVLVDTLGLVWGVVVHAADMHDSTQAHLLVEHCLGYLDRMKKILVDHAYKKGFMQWVEANVAGLEVEIASCPPSEKGFVPIKWRWVNERTFSWLNFFRRHSKDYEKTTKSAQAWILWANCQIILNRF
ncbi:IS5 family transposase [Xanthocytophaga agilis]|uniref:IS5 family transposase n=1 Tax=Xanthocytophaga agilis TaxID=3048010 RepID=A0AAE3REF3_9BACT|nr:IS5 family transposase [Xanthocytophaga agilis]MDJ1506962.1 IS5 family transposase [Xanthocytophaga agilis]